MRRTMAVLVFAVGLSAAPLKAVDQSAVGSDGAVTIRPGEAFEIAFPDRGDLAHPKFSRALEHVDQKVEGWRNLFSNAAASSEQM